ncbi:MAG: hypothetical protein WAT36_14260 [Chromatiaceae bacterium]
MRATRRYAERRLNPFLGVIQVIESDLGRAISTDGQNWEIQLYAARPVGWGSLGVTKQSCLYRHGVWSEAEGLACFPSPPTVERESARAAAQGLIAATRAAQGALPFPLRDHYERWLLDASADQRPLALLEAVTGAEPLAQGRAPKWRCTTGESRGLDADGRTTLEAQVWARAGQASRGQWFRREPDGSGMALAARAVMPGQVNDALGGRYLGADDFPELLLWEGWEEAGDRERVGRYLAALAPRLLMLPLRTATRACLEQAAANQALAVDQFHRLYPQVMDSALLVRLRVEARLRRAGEGLE